MKRPLRILLIGVGWAIMGLLVYRVGLSSVFDTIKQANGFFVILGLMVMFLSQIIRAIRWFVLFDYMISFRSIVVVYFANIAYAIFSPLRIADISIAPALQKEWKIPILTTTKFLALEKMIDFVALGVVALPGFFVMSSVLFNVDFKWAMFTPLLMIISFGVCAGMYFFGKKKIEGLYKKICILGTLSFVALLIELFAGFLLVYGFFDVKIIDYFMLKPLSILTGIFSMIPAGIGVESYSLTYLFEKMSYSGAIIGASIISVRIITMLSMMVVGQYFLYFFNFKKM